MGELKNYRWRSYTWQIAEEDLSRYPGAELIIEPKTETKKRTPMPNKSRRAPQNK